VTQAASFFFQVNTEAELRDAIDHGLTETQHLDFKRELGMNDAAKKDLASDTAAFAIHGGTLVVGVDEEDKQSPPKQQHSNGD
jgi:hypothetical protein